MNYIYPRDKVCTIRVNSEKLTRFERAREQKEGNRWHPTNLSDLVEKAIDEYVEKAKK